jgi:hypothetical protein
MANATPASSPLPYRDTKPVGAADFYLAINATFRFILARLGIDGLRRYWHDLGTNYYAPVRERWKTGGLPAVADYWRAFFAAEPGAEVSVDESADEVRLQVKTCPAIKHLRAQGREIVPCFCQHCHFVSEAIAAPAGLAVRVQGGNGACVQHFIKRDTTPAPQRIEDILEAS